MNTIWMMVGILSAALFCGACSLAFLAQHVLAVWMRTAKAPRCLCRGLVPLLLAAGLVVYAGTKPGPGPGPDPEPAGDPTLGRQMRIDLVRDLGIDIEADYRNGDKVTVKLETLPKGLKLVTTQLKDSDNKTVTNVVYTIEGVPTEGLSLETQPMYARVTVTTKVGGKSVKYETLQKANFEIAPAVPEELEAVLNEDLGVMSVTNIWPYDVSKWSFKGWPAGVKYTTKAIAANARTGAPAIPAYSIYGKPTKAGVFTVTATTRQKEQFFLSFTVWPSQEEGKFRHVNQAYVAVATNFGDQVTAASGLPTGLKFKAGDVSGTPTKPGVYAVQLTKKDPNDPQGKKTLKEKEIFLWKITAGENPGLGAGEIPWSAGHVEWDEDAMTASALQGAAISLDVDMSALDPKAKVTVSGLPSGLKFDAKSGLITGVATKVERKVVVVKVVQNGVTVTKRFALSVLDNPFAGVYRGGAITERAADDSVRLAMFEVTVAVNGKVSISYNEGKTKYSASAKSYDYDLSSATGTVKSLTFKASSDDKKAGRGDRTAELRLCSHDGLFQEVQVFIDDAFAGTGYGTVKTLDEGVTFPPLQTYVFTNEVGSALVTLSVAWDAKKATAAFTGKLFDGTAIKMSVPVCRWACKGDSADYVFAPFQVIAKDKTVYLLGEGSVDWICANEQQTSLAEPAICEKGDKKLAEVVSDTGALTVVCDGPEPETFPFAVVLDNKQNPSAVEIYDVDPQLGEKPLAKVTAKLGKTTGGITITLTSKKRDKAKYVIDLVWQDDCYLAGQVIRTWKDGKESKTAYGAADFR